MKFKAHMLCVLSMLVNILIESMCTIIAWAGSAAGPNFKYLYWSEVLFLNQVLRGGARHGERCDDDAHRDESEHRGVFRDGACRGEVQRGDVVHDGEQLLYAQFYEAYGDEVHDGEQLLLYAQVRDAYGDGGGGESCSSCN